MFHADIITRA